MRECPECGRLYPDAETACPHDGRLLALDSAHVVDPHLGRTVGSYVLVQKLGSGGMGDVYLGEHPQIGSRVAIKLLNARFAADTVIVERFFNEARAANLIGHENIVQIFDFGRLPEGIPYFVMEWLPGEPLSTRMGAPVAINDAIPIVVQITAALTAAHDAGIVHRDLKPDNIFLVRRQHGVHVKLLDFGIAKLNGVVPKAGTTASGVVMGTARYLSPEQAAGDAAHVSAASDIYSLGVILYQLTTGQLPFTRETYAEVLTAHLREPPRPPRELNPGLPRQLETVILRCLEKKPENRFTSMRELEQSFNFATSAPAASKRARSRWPIAWGAIAATTALGVAAWNWSRAPADSPPSEANVRPLPTPLPPPAASPSPAPATEIRSIVEAAPEKTPAPRREKKPAPRKQASKEIRDGFIDVEF